MAEQILRPDGLRSRKRSSDYSSLDQTMKNKRSKGAVGLQSFRHSDQLVLKAAAEILNTSLNRVLSLANLSRNTSGNVSSDSLEVVSNSSSNELSGDFNTPFGSSDSQQSGQPLDTFKIALGTQRPLGFSEPVNSVTTHHSQGVSYQGQPVEDFNLEGIGAGIDIDISSMDPFIPGHHLRHAVYPTPPDSQYSQGQLSNQLDQDSALDDQPWEGMGWTYEEPIPGYNQNQGYAQVQSSNTQEHTLHQVQNKPHIQSSDIQPYTPGPNVMMGQGLPGFDVFPNHASQTTAYVQNDSNISWMEPSQFKEEKPRQRPPEKTPGTKGRRRGPFQRSEQREETGLTRKLGACIRCSMQRIRCIPDPNSLTGCCKTCIQAAQTRTRWLPCLRYKITDSELLDNAKCPRPTWTSRWKKMEMVDITQWANGEIKTINVTQEVGNNFYTLKVRKFVPEAGDALARKWVWDDVRYEYECAPYAVPDMREAGKVLAKFSDDTVTTAIQFWIKGDTLLRRTYSMAYKYSLCAEREEDRKLLKFTLRLWGASRMMSRSANIIGQETLGMARRDFGPNSPSTNRILMPPVFSAQMEIIFVAMILEPTKKEVLSRLKTMVQDNNRRSWLAIYLCIFMLLHSSALLTARDKERAKLQGVQDRRFYRPLVIDELHNGAKILLAYFHYCNKASYPLHMDWTSEDQVAFSGLKQDQIEFLRETVKDYDSKASHFKHILENKIYEDEYYFIAQLYERDWKPRHTV